LLKQTLHDLPLKGRIDLHAFYEIQATTFQREVSCHANVLCQSTVTGEIMLPYAQQKFLPFGLELVVFVAVYVHPSTRIPKLYLGHALE
jgi:hypothetical protein